MATLDGRIGNMLRKELETDSTISNNLTGGIYPTTIPDDAPEDEPVAKWQQISGVRGESLKGDTGMTTVRIQLDVYANRHEVATQIIRDIRKKFARWRHKVLGKNPGVKVDRIRVEGPEDEPTDETTHQKRRLIDLIIVYQERL